MTMSPTILRRAALRTNVRAFSHTARALEIQNQNPSYPAFKPRVRFYLGASLITLACIETAFWFNVGPKIFGGDDDSETTR